MHSLQCQFLLGSLHCLQSWSSSCLLTLPANQQQRQTQGVCTSCVPSPTLISSHYSLLFHFLPRDLACRRGAHFLPLLHTHFHVKPSLADRKTPSIGISGETRAFGSQAFYKPKLCVYLCVCVRTRVCTCLCTHVCAFCVCVPFPISSNSISFLCVWYMPVCVRVSLCVCIFVCV